MNRISIDKQLLILQLLCEGNSIRGTARLAKVSPVTVLRLLSDTGTFCMELEDYLLTDLYAPRIQCDEMWCFIRGRAKNLTNHQPDKDGEQWIWVALDVETRFLVAWHSGDRTNEEAYKFFNKIAERVQRVETVYADEHRAYNNIGLFLAGVTRDFGQTFHVERHNLSLRTNLKRLARRTNAYSKSLHYHLCALAIYSMWYNFIKPHQTLGTTPAVAMGAADEPWTLEYLIPYPLPNHPVGSLP